MQQFSINYYTLKIWRGSVDLVLIAFIFHECMHLIYDKLHYVLKVIIQHYIVLFWEGEQTI